MSDAFTCPDCGMTSHHPDDVTNSYCGNCHQFKGDLRVGDHLRLRAEGSWEERSVLLPGDTPTMKYWQVQADLDDAPGRILFGVRAENETSALQEAGQRLDGGVSFWILEIPPPDERGN